MQTKKIPECKCEGLFKSYYFEAIDDNHKLRVKNEELRKEIKSYEETLEIMNNPEIMEQINLAKTGKIKGIPLSELESSHNSKIPKGCCGKEINPNQFCGDIDEVGKTICKDCATTKNERRT